MSGGVDEFLELSVGYGMGGELKLIDPGHSRGPFTVIGIGVGIVAAHAEPPAVERN